MVRHIRSDGGGAKAGETRQFQSCSRDQRIPGDILMMTNDKSSPDSKSGLNPSLDMVVPRRFAVLFPRIAHSWQSFSPSVCSCSSPLVAARRAASSRLCVEMPVLAAAPTCRAEALREVASNAKASQSPSNPVQVFSVPHHQREFSAVLAICCGFSGEMHNLLRFCRHSLHQ
jgi:hypothetical protein